MTTFPDLSVYCSNCSYPYQCNEISGMVGPLSPLDNGPITIIYLYILFISSKKNLCNERSGMVGPSNPGIVGPFRPTPEYEAGYSCFQQVKQLFKSQIYVFFTTLNYNYKQTKKYFCFQLSL